jgi:hypothetical protein
VGDVADGDEVLVLVVVVERQSGGVQFTMRGYAGSGRRE